MTPRCLALVSLVFASVFLACGGPRARDDVPTAPSSEPPAAVEAPPAPLRVVPFEKGVPDPRALDVLKENYAATPAKVDEAEPPALTKAALEDTARAEARGLTLVDVIHVSRVAEKGHAVLPLAVKQGDCITVIAHGGLGVMEVDAFLVEHGSSPPNVLAQDIGAGPEAILGGQRGCFPFVAQSPPQIDVVVQARKGEGNVVFAVYRGRP